MRAKALLLVGGLAAIAGAFLIGRATAADGTETQPNGTFTGAHGDVFEVPAASMRCDVGQEGGFPRVICGHIPVARYSVVFYLDNLFVYRNGEPDRPVFSAEGEP